MGVEPSSHWHELHREIGSVDVAHPEELTPTAILAHYMLAF